MNGDDQLNNIDANFSFKNMSLIVQYECLQAYLADNPTNSLAFTFFQS